MEMLAGKYELIRKLARGGMAEVFLARTVGPMGFEKELVVKRVLPHLTEETGFVDMFLNEARLAAQLNHPNIVQVFDFGEADGMYFLVMEFIDGINLRTLRRNAAKLGERIDVRVAARLASLAAEGLAYAHEFVDAKTGKHLRLVHRDVSPDNILVAKNGSVKVVDFGIAKAADQTSHTKTGTVKGKLAFMPPEQISNETLDGRADVYALGVVLYELVTGSKPFNAENDAAIIASVIANTYTPANFHRPEVPDELQAIFDKCFARRDQRYATCRALQADLERFIARGEPLSTHDLVMTVRRFEAVGGQAPALPTPATINTGVLQEQLLPSPLPPVEARREPTRVAPAKPGPPVPDTTIPATGQVPAAFNPMSRPIEDLTIPNASRKVSKPPPVGDTTIPETRRAPAPQASPSDDTLDDTGGNPFSDVIKQTRDVVLLSSPKPRKSGPSVALLVLGALAAVGVGIGAVVVVAHFKTPVVTPAPLPPLDVKPVDVKPVVAPPPVEPPPTAPPAVTPPADVKPPEPPPDVKPAVEPPAPVAVKPPPVVKRPAPHVPTPIKPEPQVTTPPPAVVTPPPAAATGTVDFRIRPFGAVFVDGKHVGDTPFAAVTLSVGPHSVRVVNSEMKLEITRTLDVQPGTNTFKHNFEP